MTEDATDAPRRASRTKQRKSYRLDDEYAFLDEDRSERSNVHSRDAGGEPDDDGDDFMPDLQEVDQDEYLEDDVADDEDDDENFEEEDDPDGEITRTSHRPRQKLRLVADDLEMEPSTPAGSYNMKSFASSASRTTQPNVVQKYVGLRDGDQTKPRARGIHNFDKVGGQFVRLKDMFGPTNEDLKPIFETRDQWEEQETYPLRKQGSLRRSFFEDGSAREKEVTNLREWYSEIGKQIFAERQHVKPLSATQGAAYMQTLEPPSLNVLLGPKDHPRLFNMKKGSFVNLSEAFHIGGDRRGWLFNLGSKVRDTHWAVNEDSNDQYLAVAVEQTSPGDIEPLESWKARAFSPIHPFAASIQIWEFPGLANGMLDTSKAPRLRLVICTEWGAPKHLRWCPYYAAEQQTEAAELTSTHIGLLAGTWSDGRIRILDVSIPADATNGEETLFLNITHAAFDVALPRTIPSCMHWLSSTSLAVATAAGTVAIWTLTHPGTFEISKKNVDEPRPWFYEQLADTYILTLSSGWPSRHQYLSITTADGFARLYDLRAPNADTTAGIRGRTLCITQAWHEHTQSFVMPDEYYMLKHCPIRRYYHNVYTARAESSITRISASPVHPGLLIGSADGTVQTINPVVRIMNYKHHYWQQRWFVHEWRRPMEEMVVKPKALDADTEMREDEHDVFDEASASNTTSQSLPSKPTPSVLSKPLARMVEGFKANQPGIQHSVSSKKELNPEVGKGVTVFEEGSAITTLGWNPNVRFGTWAVAGMGDGLLRVEELGV